ncbi:cation:proton antiporter [Devosia sp. A449]
MPYDTPVIATIAVGLVLAALLGLLAHRLKLPPVLGYLLAGILVGPHVSGLVADPALGRQLAEFGIVLLMFGVGLQVSLKEILGLRPLAITGALAQLALGILLGLGLGFLLGWEPHTGLLFGLGLSVASGVVILQENRQHAAGNDAKSWLILQNMVVVLVLLLLPAVAGLSGNTEVYDPFVSLVERLLGTSVGLWGAIALTAIKLAAFVGFMVVAGRSVIPWLLHGVARMASRELFRLTIVAIALALALGAALLFGVTLALGAFFAGMILSESGSLGRAARQTLPLRDAFAVLFFMAVGMLVDPAIILTQPLPLLATVLIIMLGKSVAAFAVMVLFRRPVGQALELAATLAQIGEFSFILASMGVALALLPPEALQLILAGTLISILLNPLVFWGASRLQPRVEARMGARDEQRIEPTETVPEPKLPPSDNLLSKAAATPVAVAPAAVVATEVVAAEAEPEAVEAEPEAAATVPPEEPADNVIILAPPPAAPSVDASDTTTPAVGEAPAAIDEVMVSTPTEPETSEPEPPEPAETPAEVAEELAEQEADLTSEGGPPPPEPEPETETPEPVTDSAIPHVVPEPKS